MTQARDVRGVNRTTGGEAALFTVTVSQTSIVSAVSGTVLDTGSGLYAVTYAKPNDVRTDEPLIVNVQFGRDGQHHIAGSPFHVEVREATTGDDSNSGGGGDAPSIEPDDPNGSQSPGQRLRRLEEQHVEAAFGAQHGAPPVADTAHDTPMGHWDGKGWRYTIDIDRHVNSVRDSGAPYIMRVSTAQAATLLYTTVPATPGSFPDPNDLRNSPASFDQVRVQQAVDGVDAWISWDGMWVSNTMLTIPRARTARRRVAWRPCSWRSTFQPASTASTRPSSTNGLA